MSRESAGGAKHTRRWHRVEMPELETIWRVAQSENRVTNGHTHADLQAKYGADNIKHVLGHGWYKLVQS
jgi:hypothetical protein